MLFWSKYAAFRVNVRAKIEVMHPTLPRVLSTVEPLVAEFAGVLGAEQSVDTPDGTIRVADISGHYFDSVVAQEQNRWTDDEREEVEETLLALFKRQPEYGHLVEAPKAALPWPTYDDTPRDRIVEMAGLLGLVGEALAWEQENANRKTVTGPLSDILDKQAALAEEEGALTAV